MQMKSEGNKMDFNGNREVDALESSDVTDVAPFRILLVDDHFLFADALKSMICARWPGCETVHVEHALDLECFRPFSQSFDIVLLDLRMPGMEEPEQIGRIVEMAGGAPVVLMSGLATGTEIDNAFRAGVSGFIPKSRPGDEFLDFVAGILSRDPNHRVVQPKFAQNDAVLSKLSPRETETARLMARGLSNKEIAVELQISPETVKVYTKSIMTKFSVRNRTEFAIEAVRRGIV
jgi:two-component system nitrate/nitrite response regulator NarL